jgi:hypothetical protein
MKITKKQEIRQRAYKLHENKGIWVFSYNEHFLDMSINTFKNNICELRKEKEVVKIPQSQSQFAFINCIPDNAELLKQIELKNEVPIVGIKRTEIVPIHLNTLNAIHTCLQSALWDEDNNIHNVTLTTSIPQFFKYLKSEGHKVDESNNSINLFSKRINDLSLKAFVYHTDKIEIFISNSNNPIMVNVDDIKRLRSTLEQFRIHLGQYTVNVPQLDYGFKVVKFDYAHDAIVPICVSFAYNYYNFEGELIQIYTKRSNSFLTELRYEKRNIHPNELFFGDFEHQLLPLFATTSGKPRTF